MDFEEKKGPIQTQPSETLPIISMTAWGIDDMCGNGLVSGNPEKDVPSILAPLAVARSTNDELNDAIQSQPLATEPSPSLSSQRKQRSNKPLLSPAELDRQIARSLATFVDESNNREWKEKVRSDRESSKKMIFQQCDDACLTSGADSWCFLTCCQVYFTFRIESKQTAHFEERLNQLLTEARQIHDQMKTRAHQGNGNSQKAKDEVKKPVKSEGHTNSPVIKLKSESAESGSIMNVTSHSVANPLAYDQSLPKRRKLGDVIQHFVAQPSNSTSSNQPQPESTPISPLHQHWHPTNEHIKIEEDENEELF